ncbi:hypothetical protein ACJX0J_040174 [Zea mays]
MALIGRDGDACRLDEFDSIISIRNEWEKEIPDKASVGDGHMATSNLLAKLSQRNQNLISKLNIKRVGQEVLLKLTRIITEIINSLTYDEDLPVSKLYDINNCLLHIMPSDSGNILWRWKSDGSVYRSWKIDDGCIILMRGA